VIRPLAFLCALSMALAVALGAIGAHAIGPHAVGPHAIGDDLIARRLWDTASFWHVAHTLGLFALAALWPRLAPRLGAAAVLAIALGAIAFCGTLYVQARTGMAPVPLLAPIGGMLLIIGWILAGLALLRHPAQNSPAQNSPAQNSPAQNNQLDN
jgi:uncharacterized membrane protein YgdD (TMEM256/DUF423 family)